MRRAADLTVAVSTCDRPQLLVRCLNALLSGEVLPTEVIVVDQGHQDVAGAIGAVDDRGVPVRHMRQERRGLAASRNLALATARCGALAVTDDDCVPDGSWIAAIERALGGTDAPDAVTGRVLPLGPESPGLHAVASRTDTRSRVFVGRALPWEVGTGANFAARRESLERIGGYDERLGVGTGGSAAEDVDVLYRLLRSGARIRYEPDALVLHERQPRNRREATRWSYGRGVGTCCGLWLRAGDPGGLRVLAGWLALRLRLLAVAGRDRSLRAARDELRVVAGTALGLTYGLCCAPHA